MIAGDHGQRHIDPRRNTSRGDQVAILDIDLIGRDMGLREPLDQAFGVVPVRGYTVTVKQTGVPQDKSASAD
ncbi:hypothetical protein D3C81_1936420 [compost metagenome]